MKTEKDGDKEIQVAYITLSGEGQQAKKLTDHLTAELDADTVKLLQGSGTQQQETGGVRRFPAQTGDEKPPSGAKTEDEFRRATEQTVNYVL